MSPEILASVSADRTVKLWDLRKTNESISSINVSNPVEDFCVNGDKLYVAHGNVISLVSYKDEKLELLNDFSLF